MKWRGATVWGIVLLTIGLVLFGAWLILNNIPKPATTVTIGTAVVKAKVASTDAERERGLSGVEVLSDTSGMLFVFNDDGPQGIWMKDMKINLDIIWLDTDKRVVHIERKVTPASYPKVYQSPKPARYVLEIPAGRADKTRITLGKTAVFDVP